MVLLRIVESVLYQQCVAMYESMFNEAATDNGEVIWRGRITQILPDVGNNYIHVTRALTAMKCIRQLERGTRGSRLSMYSMLRPPTAELFNRYVGKTAQNTAFTRNQLYSMVVGLTERVERLERALGSLMEGSDE